MKNIKNKRKLTGVVVSDKMNKTVVVRIDRRKKHLRYKKYYTVSSRFKAHNEENQYKAGDKVIMEESRPLSKDKRWVVINKV